MTTRLHYKASWTSLRERLQTQRQARSYPPSSHEARGFGTTDDNVVNGFGVFHIDNNFGGNDKFMSLDAEDDSATRSPCLTAHTVGVGSQIAEDLPASLRGDFVSPFEIAKYFASLHSNADAYRAQAIRDFHKLILRIAQPLHDVFDVLLSGLHSLTSTF